MIEWLWLLVPTIIAILFYAAWRVTVQDLKKAVFAVQLVEMEYRLMSQNNALFDYVEATHKEIMEKVESEMRGPTLTKEG